MIRALATTRSGRRLLVLGIDRENVRRLTGGDPIYVQGNAHGLDLDVDVVVAFGEELQDILDEITSAGVEIPTHMVPS